MGKKKPFRRQYIINPSFQIRWSLLFALVAGMTATFFAVPFYSALETQNELLRRSVATQEQLYNASQDITVLLMNMPETTQPVSEEAGARFDEAYRSFQSLEAGSREMIAANESKQTLVVASVPIIALVLFGIGILITHQVAGPLYVIKQQLEAYAATHRIDERSLRKGDEFLDVYATMYRALSKDEPEGGEAQPRASA